jgi:hypothetical protein
MTSLTSKLFYDIKDLMTQAQLTGFNGAVAGVQYSASRGAGAVAGLPCIPRLCLPLLPDCPAAVATPAKLSTQAARCDPPAPGMLLFFCCADLAKLPALELPQFHQPAAPSAPCRLHGKR